MISRYNQERYLDLTAHYALSKIREEEKLGKNPIHRKRTTRPQTRVWRAASHIRPARA